MQWRANVCHQINSPESTRQNQRDTPDWLSPSVISTGFSFGGGTVSSRPLLKYISPLQLSGSAALIALPVHLLLASGRYKDSAPELQSVNLWLIILYAGILSSGLALPMWNFGVRHAGAAHAAIIQNLIPLIAIAATWFSRGEAATAAQLFGGALILGGLVIMRFSRRRGDSAHPEQPVNAE